MEEKMVKIPFNLERAKRIQAGEEPGRIVTRDRDICDYVEILSSNFKNDYPIIAALHSSNADQLQGYNIRGRKDVKYPVGVDLMLEVPERMRYCEGDVLRINDGSSVAIYKEYKDGWFKFYAVLNMTGELFISSTEESYSECKYRIEGYASEWEEMKFVNALRWSDHSLAKEYLKRFFGIEFKEKTKYKFQPFQPVLVREYSSDVWVCHLFSQYDSESCFRTIGGGIYNHCIPYNEQTKHLIGTTDEWEEE